MWRAVSGWEANRNRRHSHTTRADAGVVTTHSRQSHAAPTVCGAHARRTMARIAAAQAHCDDWCVVSCREGGWVW